MKTTRPINLDLTTLKFPLPAIASILHRISGISLIVMLPISLYLLDMSLSSAEGFAHAAALLANPLLKIVFWLLTVAMFYHLCAGIRHIIMDIGFGESLSAGRLGAKLVFVATAILAIWAGVVLW